MSFVNRPCGFRVVKRNRCPQRRSQGGITRHFCLNGGMAGRASGSRCGGPVGKNKRCAARDPNGVTQTPLAWRVNSRPALAWRWTCR